MSKKESRFLIHKKNDMVGVATYDLSKGKKVTGTLMDSGNTVDVTLLDDVPLGHKISLRDIKLGEKVLEYGEVIGGATKKIKKGEHVHTHNLQSLRWKE